MDANDKKKLINQTREVIESTINENDKTKQIVQNRINKEKDLCDFLDKSSHNLETEKKILYSFPEEDIGKIPDEYFTTIEGFFIRGKNNLEFIKQMRNDVAEESEKLNLICLSGEVYASLTASATTSSHDTWKRLHDENPSVWGVLVPIEIEDSWISDRNYIEPNLEKIIPGLIPDFINKIKNWNSDNSDEQKYNHLLPLRSFITHRIFDNICSKKSVEKTAWYKRAIPKTLERELRYSQMKYFIIQNSDDRAYPSATQMQINSLSKDFADIFHNMSEYGKNGCIGLIADDCFKRTLNIFANAIRLRFQLSKNSKSITLPTELAKISLLPYCFSMI